MPRPRFLRPETTRIEISQGDYLIVKTRLTAGEYRQMYASMRRDDQQVDRLKVIPGRVLAYLVDWSIVGLDGKKVEILNQPPDVVRAALDAMDVESYKEISDAVDAHIEVMEKLREQEKNGPSGESK